MRRALSLLQQNALRLVAVFVTFQLVAAVAVMSLLMLPLAHRAASDFAQLMVLAAQTFAELPPTTRPAFLLELETRHGIVVLEQAPAGARSDGQHGPYVRNLEEALTGLSGSPVRVFNAARDGEAWHWAELPSGQRKVWLGFSHDRVGTQPLTTALLILAAGLLLAIATAWWLARRTLLPLQRLDAAAAALGRGERPELLPEAGPREIAALARRVNALARQVQDLLEARTTLLAGLSHDLRTPLARMRLNLELLERRPDSARIARLDADIQEMDRLVGETMELARGLGREAGVATDVPSLLEGLAQQTRESGVQVSVAAAPITVTEPPMAIHRLLGNLLSNAQRYGGGAPIELKAESVAGGCRIGVLDRGPGIPADQLEAVFHPFHRVETSRNPATGGSGLGLAIVRQLAQANGWQVSLENRAGGGLEAWVVLPAAGEDMRA
ncbi:MAG: HAMP domain-containing protein [Steroidobacteraceae bacterium]|nr:HAMP domain-containing protein [Steroidobacteraceae bacterium]MCC7201031.1 HAMP domain-containing protein [Gammaproteobacteria bacterium]